MDTLGFTDRGHGGRVHRLLVLSASRRLRIKSGDLDHGDLQGEKFSKFLILRQPSGGLPDPNIQHQDRMCCFVPIYGTRDAGRGLWRRIRKVLIKQGFAENFIMPALYSYATDGIVMVLLASHVDDIKWAADPEAERAIEAIKRELMFGALEEGSFSFCGVKGCVRGRLHHHGDVREDLTEA